MKTNLYCSVCGLEQLTPPWGLTGREPSFEICVCCGVEFGYEDSTFKGVKKYRENWIGQGTHWFNDSFKPDNWSLQEQMSNIPLDYK
jgi:hypothetical protein